MKKLVHAACPHDCPDACGVVITVEDGRAVKIQGDPEHPVTRGFLCAKVARYLDRVYSPDRVLHPLKRVAPKGPGTKYERISWDEALDTIAARFKQIAGEFGPEAILPYSYAGTLGVLNNASMDRRFFHRLGASRLDRTICSNAGGEGLKSVLGVKYGTEPEQFRQAKTIIAWGANIHGNSIHLWPFIQEARRNGARLIVIDPYRTRTAECADWYLPIIPGTDLALALGMMHVIIGEGLYDAEYIARYTVGFDELRNRVEEYTPERVSNWTGIAAEDIRKLAREYATARPAAIRVNYGVQRCDNGGMAVRAITMLPCITGSWKEIGGGLALTSSGAFAFDRQALEREDLMSKPARIVNMTEIGRALTAPLRTRRAGDERFLDPPIKALLVYNSNPAAIAPDHGEVVRGLMREELFTVVHEQFLTDTCDYADIVLPATTFFEHKDLVPSYGHYYLQLSQPAIEPLGECRSNVEVFGALAQRMGFEDACFDDSADKLIETALASGSHHLAEITRKRLERDHHVRLSFGAKNTENGESNAFLPFGKGGFQTPSGKAELYSRQLASLGLDPVASFTPPTESRHAAQTGKYPLELLARKADNFLNSTFANLAFNQQLEARDTLDLHPDDAKTRGIRNGDEVRVFNDRGELRLKARLDGGGTRNNGARVPRGTVAAQLAWAKFSRGGKNVNVLTSDRLTDLGRGPTFYSVLVEVERVAD
jgi:molybdopterin guanine dinucleotide-containing S/N-oxide reductase-like protein